MFVSSACASFRVLLLLNYLSSACGAPTPYLWDWAKWDFVMSSTTNSYTTGGYYPGLFPNKFPYTNRRPTKSRTGTRPGTTPASNPIKSPLPPPVSPSQNPSSYSSNQGDIQKWLDAHNVVRQRYSAPNLRWNPNLVSAAARQSSRCYFQHTEHNSYGENIAAGQTSIEQVLRDWVDGPDEKEAFDRADPNSHSHWTQVVWADSEELGCYIETCDSMGGVSLGPGPIKFFVCEYNPPGNVQGQSQREVHAATGGAPISSEGYA